MTSSRKINPLTFSRELSNSKLIASNAIKEEDEQSKIQFENRKTRFLSILNNISHGNNASLKYVVYMFASIIIIIMSTFVYTLIPAHNLMVYPSFWYEVPIQIGFSYLPFEIANTIFRISNYSNIEFIKSNRVFQKIFMVMFVLLLAQSAICNMVWKDLLNYKIPVPLNGLISTLLIVFGVITAIWLTFPSQWRKNTPFLIRLKAAITAYVVNKFVAAPYRVIKEMMLKCPSMYQWIIGLFIPFVPHLMVWLLLKWVKKAVNGDVTRAEIACNQAVSGSHAFIVAYIIGSIATVETSAILLGIGFIMNMYICLKLIYLKKKRPMEVDLQIGLLQELVINEIIEFMVPPIYLATLIIAFYGPEMSKMDIGVLHRSQTLTTLLSLFLSSFLSITAKFLFLSYFYGHLPELICIKPSLKFRRNSD